METRALTAKDIVGWLTPRQSVEILSAVFGHDSHSYIAKDTLLGRLAGGMVIAASAQTLIDDSKPARRILNLLRIDGHL